MPHWTEELDVSTGETLSKAGAILCPGATAAALVVLCGAIYLGQHFNYVILLGLFAFAVAGFFMTLFGEVIKLLERIDHKLETKTEQ